MAERIYIHLAQSSNYNLRFTKGKDPVNPNDPHPAPDWEEIAASDARADGTAPSWKEITRYKRNGSGANTGRGKESIQIVLVKTGAGEAAAVVNLFGVRGGGAFKSKRPAKGGGQLKQRLIAKFVVNNGVLNFQKTTVRESLTPRAAKTQQNHRPTGNDYKHVRFSKSKVSGIACKPGPVRSDRSRSVVGSNRPGIVVDLGGFRLAFSPQAVTPP
ncbi:MAG: hypothetical protein U1F71_13550 [Verrucomicrobiaceae bacterium]